MSKSVKYFLFALTFVLMGLLIGFYVKDNVGGSTRISSDQGLKKLQQSLYFIENNYVEEPQRTQLIEEAIQGITDNLDPHSFYIPAKEMVQMQEQMEGSFEGIGIQFNILEDTIYVETPLSGGPSEKIGIKAGDRIIQVNGETVAGIGITNTQVMKYLKGEKGSQVNLAIARRGQSDLLSFTVTRDRIPLNSVEYSYMITDQIGYIRVSRFAETTYKEFIQSLKRLQTEGMSHLILDLRNNPGGYMTKAIHMADDFLSPGKVIVSNEGRR
ncbi:MAG: S41 family peptidase, partial [Bacteroidota bacterium]